MPIKNIYINGNELLTDEIIIEESKLSDYPSFLLTSSSGVIKNLRKNKYIEDVKIKKKMGNIIEINVKEYDIILSINGGKEVLLSNGEVLENTYNFSDVAVLSGELAPEKRVEFAKKISKVNKDILRQISQVEYKPVKVDEGRFLLYMDDGNLVYVTLTKLHKLNKYNKIKDKLMGKIGIIYLDSGDYVEIKDNKAAVSQEKQ